MSDLDAVSPDRKRRITALRENLEWLETTDLDAADREEVVMRLGAMQGDCRAILRTLGEVGADD
jgi:hypothetical protein